MGARSQNSLRPGYDHIELMMFGSENLKNDIDVMNQLINLSKYPFRTSSWLGPFHTIDTAEAIKEKFGYSYLWFLPEIFGELEVEDSSEAYTIKFLPLVPLYEEERNVLARMDETSEKLRDELLEAIEEDISMFHIDVHRPNFAPEAEQQLTIFDEAREAFANDIKEMLQEFIDMGDIDCEEVEEN
jgi:tRNA uridine 5-carbamoylmethylation protein Kti12